MTQEEKQLLLKDLCARLSYGVKGIVYAETTKGEYDINGDMIFFDSPFDVTLDEINTSTEEIHVIAIGNEDTVDFIEDQQIDGKPYTIDEFKPYLRPMSSMTEEEWKEFEEIFDFPIGAGYNTITKKFNVHNYVVIDKGYRVEILLDDIANMLNWLNSRHFDYRSLIRKGLALEAPEGMYHNTGK